MVHNFLFHRVNPQRDIMWDPMDTALFEKCIRFISKNYTVVLLEELLASGIYSAKEKIATIMFDDGYKDNIEYAAPILAKYNCRASFYVVTNCIENNTLIWTHILEHTFQHTNNDTINFQFSFLPEALKIKKLSTSQERINYLNRLKPFAKLITHEQRSEILSAVQQNFTDVSLPELMMNWDDIHELKNAGHYIGSHTVNHHMLGTMSNSDDIYFELLESRNKIKERLGYFPISISYPVGSYNSTTIELSKKAGYSIGLAVKQAVYNPAIDSVFEIPRIELFNESWLKTRLRMANLLEKIKTLIHYNK